MDNTEARVRPKCEAGDGDACLELGFHLLGLKTVTRSSRVPIDFKSQFLQFKASSVARQKAVEQFRKGCANGNGEACYFVWEYEQPFTNPISAVDPPTTKVWQNNPWLKKAGDAAYNSCLAAENIDANVAYKCYQAGRWLMMSNDFHRGTVAYTRAITGLRKACQANDDTSCFILSQAELTKDQKEEMATRACFLGNSTACLTLALRHKDGHRIPEARKLLQQACEQSKDGGHPGACLTLGQWLASGLHVQQDNDKAFHFFRLACKLGEPQACEYEEQYSRNKSFGSNVKA